MASRLISKSAGYRGGQRFRMGKRASHGARDAPDECHDSLRRGKVILCDSQSIDDLMYMSIQIVEGLTSVKLRSIGSHVLEFLANTRLAPPRIQTVKSLGSILYYSHLDIANADQVTLPLEARISTAVGPVSIKFEKGGDNTTGW